MPTHLVTGANRGIGRAVVELLRDDDLLLAGRDRGALEALCGELPSARPLVLDLARPDALAAAWQQLPPPAALDGLLHVGGISTRGRVEELSASDWTEQLAVNVVAVAELTRLALPALRAASGAVVLVNSGAGLRAPGPGGVAYGTSKHALRALADGLRAEEPALRVTSVYPGRVATRMQRELRAHEGGEYREEDYLRPETVARAVVDVLRTPADAVVPDLSIRPRAG